MRLVGVAALGMYTVAVLGYARDPSGFGQDVTHVVEFSGSLAHGVLNGVGGSSSSGSDCTYIAQLPDGRQVCVPDDGSTVQVNPNG
jgi:hypothetical protein